MAKIVEEIIVVRISRIVKDDAVDETRMDREELIATLETVAQELIGDSAVVEVVLG